MMNKRISYHLFNIILTIAAILLISQSFAARGVSAGWDTGLLIPAFSGLVMIIIVVVRFMKKGQLIENINTKRIMIILVSAGLTLFLIIGSILIIDPIVHGPDQFPKQQKTWIVVLGCHIKADGSPTWALQNRLESALLWGGKYSNTEYIVSGGQGFDEPFSEGLSMAIYLENHGVNSHSIAIEDQSTSTLENFMYSRIVMEEKGWQGEPILFVTNDFHVFRARMLAKRCGFTAYGIPAKTPAVIRVNSYLRETLALIKSLLFDWPVAESV